MNLLSPAPSLAALRVPPSNRLEALKGTRAGQHSICINDQWRSLQKSAFGIRHSSMILRIRTSVHCPSVGDGKERICGGFVFGRIGWIDSGSSQPHSLRVLTKQPSIPAAGSPWIFPLACWALGLMGIVQLLVAGMALATRLEESRQIRIVEKEVFKSVVVRDLKPPPVPAATSPNPAVVSRPPAPPPPVAPQMPPTPLIAPRIADPGSERMVKEARQARVAGDMGKAVMMLEEALSRSPEDPAVHYELGMVHEQMGVFDTAARHYEKVFQIGVSGAGALYELAAGKLRDGFEQPNAMQGKLALGRVRIFNNPNHENGQRVILTIPVQKSPADEIDVGEIAVSVVFFNRNARGEIVQLEDKTWVAEQWVTLPFDWTGGEECLRMTYTIPPQDVPTEHLFGTRTYYGQVVSLIYKGEVLDVQAWPRDLAVKIPQAPTAAPSSEMLPEFQDQLPPDFDPAMPLLPALPEK